MPAVDSKGLTASKLNKNDEWYTRFEDIAAELPRYKEQMRGMRIICPCDWDESLDEALVYASEEYVAGSDLFSPGGTVKVIDAGATDKRIMADINAVKCNFVKFLITHAEDYGIEAVSVSGYNPATGEGVRFQDIDYSKYDLVITNPPFSQFREFIDTMFANRLKFLVIGPKTALTYKETFRYFKSNEMWLGYQTEVSDFNTIDGSAVRSPCLWYTNLDVSCRRDRLILTEEYNPETNPRYANYDAIEVGDYRKIPYDYAGEMGVPVTFLRKYNPDQFEIIGSARTMNVPLPPDLPKRFKSSVRFYIKLPDGDYKSTFDRIVIRNKHPEVPDAS